VFIIKFLVGYIVYQAISEIGLYLPEFASLFEEPLKLPISIMLGVSFVILPLTLSYTIMILLIGVQISSNTELALIVTLALLCLLFFYARLAPKESILILATLAAFKFNIPYVVPMLAGLYMSLTTIIPISIGVFLWNFIPIIQKLLSTQASAGLNVANLPSTLGDTLPELLEALTGQNEWVFSAFIFAVIVLAVYGISHMGLDYSKDIGVGLGSLLAIISFIIAHVLADMNLNTGEMVFFVILSAIVAEIVRFFDIVLDYGSAERVEFEDGDNYYYVKIVPKIVVNRHEHARRRASEDYEE
jgi:hypothetical protein